MKVTLVHGKYFNSWEALGLSYIGAYIKSHVKDIEYVGKLAKAKKLIAHGKDIPLLAAALYSKADYLLTGDSHF
mgnify:CR=1 FL=1